VCMLCRRAEVDLNICGDMTVCPGLCVHTYCMVLASGLLLPRNRSNFRLGDVRRVIREAVKKCCFVCGKTGAAITCWDTGCSRSFHLPCATQGQCVTQFFGLYRSFCPEHRPQQAAQPWHKGHNTCSICLNAVELQTSYGTMACPVCQDARFHRLCIQRLALQAGIAFRCPHCRNQEPFMTEMLTMGIQVLKRPQAWQSNEVRQPDPKYITCDASKCLCPQRRQHTEEQGPWELLLCSSCTTTGTHRYCSFVGPLTDSWMCQKC
ncbi:PHD finger protein 7, partial [Acanthisitta chloris]